MTPSVCEYQLYAVCQQIELLIKLHKKSDENLRGHDSESSID